MHLLNNWLWQLQTLQVHVHRSHDVESSASCDLDLGNEIILVNAFPPKQLDIEASNFADA